MQVSALHLLFGLKVSILRQQRGLTYLQLAEKANTTISYLSDIEKGKKYPSTDKIMAIAGALGISYDELVSVRGMKKLDPIVDLLESGFFKTFPLQIFGLQPAKIVEILSVEPEKVNAFVRAMMQIAQSYHVTKESLFSVALRSYQDMYDNYFPDLEQAALRFRAEHGLGEEGFLTKTELEACLDSVFGVKMDRTTLGAVNELRNIRSYFQALQHTLYINKDMSTAQERFLLARELGFQFLQMKVRPYETIIQQADDFELLHNNFRASYFASALLMPETLMVRDIQQLASNVKWDPKAWTDFLLRFDVTSEMFMQRMTNILPTHFGIKDLFFLRIEGNAALDNFTMTKELHLSGRQSPTANQRGEHYCRRWISIDILRKLRVRGVGAGVEIGVQISQYYQSERAYLCISMAKPGHINRKTGVSVTLGLLLNEATRKVFRCIEDAEILRKTVNVTCENCAISDCMARAAAPTEIERHNEMMQVQLALKSLGN